ncbi:MAG TPA: FkbM family methyltransferase [Candidatus Sulfotelmatobacter sp.]|nr:FkbM family methyltransferase [Candidatus Sulfotelmatobacter sp.]
MDELRGPWTASADVPLAIVRARYGLMAYNPNDMYIGRSIALYGEFGEQELDVMRMALPEGGIAFDVGANIGTHAVALARHVGPAGGIFAFEPQRVVHGFLATNATLNGLSWIHPVHAAIGAKRGEVLMPDYAYGNEGNYGAIALTAAERGWPVRVLTLDEYLWLPRVDLVKIDVEGMEAQVIDGARGFLDRFRPVLFVENDRSSTSVGILERLLAARYRVYWHFVPLYRENNYRGERQNVFGNTGTINVLCIPAERPQSVGLIECVDPHAPPPVTLAPF